MEGTKGQGVMDNLLTPEVAYMILVTVAWVWAISQWVWLVRFRTGWRLTTALWLTTKALFFTWAGGVFWFDWFDAETHAILIWSLATVHLIAFVHWVRLDPEGDSDAKPMAGIANDEP